MTDSTPSTDLVYAAADLDQRKGYARAIASAGDLLPRSLWAPVRMEDGRVEQRPSPGKVLLMTETGNMLGIHPIAALNGVNIIEGKPTVSPALMRALIQRAGHKVRVREKGTIEGGDYAVTVTIVRSDDPDEPFTSTWTPHRAARAGLCTYVLDPKTKTWQVRARSQNGKILPWEAYTEALCLARATREAANQGASDVIMGVYTPEELGANVNEAGELVDLTSTAVDRTPPRSPAPAEPAAASEPVDAELVDEQEDEQAPPDEPEESPGAAPQPAYDAAIGDEWAAQIADATRLGNPRTDTSESDTLAGVLIRAQHAGVLSRLVDDPARVPHPKTIEQLIDERRRDLAQMEQEARELRARQEAGAA